MVISQDTSIYNDTRQSKRICIVNHNLFSLPMNGLDHSLLGTLSRMLNAKTKQLFTLDNYSCCGIDIGDCVSLVTQIIMLMLVPSHLKMI